MKLLKTSLLLSAFLLIGNFAHAQCTALFQMSHFQAKVGDTILFTDSSSHSPFVRPNYYWTFGDGSTSNNMNTAHVYSKAGVYAVCLTISDSMRNCYDTYCDSIIIGKGSGGGGSKCAANFNYTVDRLDKCKYSFTDNSSGTTSGTNYSWSFGTATGTNGKSTSYKFTNSGYYNVTLTISDSTNNCSSTITKNIYVQGCGSSSSCKASYTSYPDSTNGCKMYFNNTSSTTASGLNYIWYFGDGNSSTAQNPGSHTYNSNGWYAVTLTMYDSSRACTDSYTDSIYVQGCGSSSSKCKADFTATPSVMNKCLVSITNKSKNTSSYYWSFGDGKSSTAAQPRSHTYTKSGTYTIMLIASDSGCADTMYQRITIQGCGGSKCTYSVSGQIKVGSNFAQYGTVYLIEKKGNNLKLVDTTYIDSMGFYWMGNLCAGTYYLKAALAKADPNYKTNLPTYYGNVLRWDSATTITISNANLRSKDIDLLAGRNPGGKGFIGGNVKKGANKKVGEPIEGVQLMILNENLEPVAYTYSDKDGKFLLDQLALGKYWLLPEVPGLSSPGTWIELTEEKSGKEDVIVEVNSTYIATDLIELASTKELKLFPNPAEDILNINRTNVNFTIVNSIGKIVKSGIIKNNSISLSDLNEGIYFIQVENSVTRIIKN